MLTPRFTFLPYIWHICTTSLSSPHTQSLFHATSLQKTHQSALQVQQKAEVLLQAGHYDADAIRECAEKVALHWQQLMLKMEDRLKLVNASVAFYKTSEQVSWKVSFLGHSKPSLNQ